jgi:cellulose synthase/poly-beta-1,6-N-acetylglucosamine synthase-like glycosyltransferase/spore germination protein YaaH/peptidoglycan/xylan/chitin deacetylase (PgdA/CDA1 family)
MEQHPQIFQSKNKSRWQRTKWAMRTLLFLLPLIALVVFIGIYFMNKNQPDIPLEGTAIKKVLTDTTNNYRESKLEREYKGFKKAINSKWAKGQGIGQVSSKPLDLSTSKYFSDSLGIRAAFYVNWDASQSFNSLQNNIKHLNLILPEWMFIDPNADTLYNTIDPKALKVMQDAGVKIMPLLTNNYKTLFRGETVKRIINNPAKKQRLINDIIATLKKYNFVGVNIDFEELILENDAPLIAFQKSLYEQLHAQNLLVSQDVIPFNDDYNFTALSKYNDYLILMAYDQHNGDSKPGPNSSQKWIEAAVLDATHKMPANKIILAIPAFGHDWQLNKKGKVLKQFDVTYQQAIANARNSDAHIDYDNDSYNLDYQYYDSEDHLHKVYFVDAATNFNSIRFATEINLAGTALWRLGGEDVRLWSFYNKPMTKAALKSFDFVRFNKIKAGSAPDFVGDGEVLDIIASPEDGFIRSEIDTSSMLIAEEYYDKLPSTYVIRRFGATPKKKLVLTFDDGPDPKYTKQILDTLAYYHVPATFFVVGYQAENNIPLIKRIFREGHEIGNHTFTHQDMSKVSRQWAGLEMDATRLLIECITGHSTILFRAPFNADSEPGKYEELAPIALSRQKNYITVGESIDPEDWQIPINEYRNDTIFNRVVDIYQRKINTGNPEDTSIAGSIILLHDAGGNRENTVNATGKIIRYFRSQGYSFTTVADLLGKKPEDMMPTIQKGKEYYWLQINYILAEGAYLGGNFFFAIFMIFLALSTIRIIVIGIMALLEKRKKIKLDRIENTLAHPFVSIIVPAYNEEVNAVSSLQNLLKCDYLDFEIIFIDDGSKDNTYQIVKDAFEGNPLVKVYTKQNGGKASALQYGIGQSHADYVVCIDADTKLAPDAVSKLMRNFMNPLNEYGQEVGAVAGSVIVGNEVNLLTKWQSIEYITSQNFDRKGFAYLNAITVIPGAIGAFKKDALIEAGGFTTDTLAEDCDITMRIIKAGYIVANEPKAYAYTEVPEHLKQFLKQRVRWSFGVMQTFWKHKDYLFNNNNKALGWVALPDMLLFKYIIPFLSPIADFLMLVALLTGNGGKIAFYFIIYVIVDALIASFAFAFEKENPLKLIWLVPQRLIYRWLMMYVFFKAIKRAIKGELQEWGVLKRTGNVKDILSRD